MNICLFTGRTTKDIELRYTQDQKAFGRFSLAVDNGYGDNKKTSFFNIVAFGNQAESIEKHVKKGTKIAVRCRAERNDYTDKNGITHRSVEFILYEWEFAQAKAENANTSQSEPAQQSAPADGFMPMPDDLDADLPFA